MMNDELALPSSLSSTPNVPPAELVVPGAVVVGSRIPPLELVPGSRVVDPSATSSSTRVGPQAHASPIRSSNRVGAISTSFII
jgi:hypothetical protein